MVASHTVGDHELFLGEVATVDVGTPPRAGHARARVARRSFLFEDEQRTDAEFWRTGARGRWLCRSAGPPAPPLLYYDRRYHSVGDEVFMSSFEDTTLQAQLWTHEVRALLLTSWASGRQTG